MSNNFVCMAPEHIWNLNSEMISDDFVWGDIVVEELVEWRDAGVAYSQIY